MKILIPNATGPTNIGDDAILAGLLLLLKENYPDAQMTIHASHPELYPDHREYAVKSTLYHLAVFDSTNFFIRTWRLILLFCSYLLFPHFILKSRFSQILADYRAADLIVFVGGGALRTRAGIKQSLNFLMQLALFAFAHKVKAFKIVAPISFGPFHRAWQAKLAARFLGHFNEVFVREDFSYDIAKENGLFGVLRGHDHAFLLPRISNDARMRLGNERKIVIAFTVRSWLSKKEQIFFESSVAGALARFAQATRASIQPVVQVISPIIAEDDTNSTHNVIATLKKGGCDVLPVKKLIGVEDAVEVYGQVDLLLGMRMHSNILAATQGTPFVAIEYEYKTQGIAEDLGMEDYVIKCEDVTVDVLYKLLVRAYESREKLREHLKGRVKEIQEAERKRWGVIFQELEVYEE